MALPRLTSAHEWLFPLTARLSLPSPTYAPHQVPVGDLRGRGAMAEGERMRLRPVIDAVAAVVYGLGTSDLRHILREVDLPVADLRQSYHALNVCGFWRVDRDDTPELRHTVLTQIAFHHLLAEIAGAGGDLEHGVTAFLKQNHGDGWLLPETVRLADYGLGHDDRAKHHQPVASRLGPRFYDWQLVQTADEALRERHRHARNLLGELDYARLLRDAERTAQEPTEEPLRQVAEPRAKYQISQSTDDQTDIFE